MKLKIAGCRGSLPSPSGRDISGVDFSTHEFGGNTTCYYLEADNGRRIILDAGSGIAGLGRYMLKNGTAKDAEIDLYITHTHWDHIQGFPFFTPAYIKGNKIDIYGEAQIKGDLIDTINKTDPSQVSKVLQVNGVGVKDVLADQQKARNFPAPIQCMAGLRGFYDFIPGGLMRQENGLRVDTRRINHPGGCVSYKISEKGKVLVVSTDFEPDENGKDDEIVDWWQGADVVIADGQYETGSKQNPFMKSWGHSDPFVNLELARRAKAKRIIMTHHDPKSDDNYLNELEVRVKQKASELGLSAEFAREGDSLEI